MKSIITSGKDALWQAENGEMIQVNLSGSGDKKKNYLSNQSNIIEEGGGSATARTSKPNTTNKGENTNGKNH